MTHTLIGRPKVKICGITNLADAEAAVEYGADALGFVFAKGSPRCIEPETAKQIIAALPPFVTTVGVFTDGDEETIQAAIDQIGLSLIQFHGSFSTEILSRFSNKAIFVISVRNENDLRSLPPVPVRATLLDSVGGGSGIPFDWKLAAHLQCPIILAGGLTQLNVREAIAAVSPYAVDVCSGVECEKGKKDQMKMKQFIEAAKQR